MLEKLKDLKSRMLIHMITVFVAAFLVYFSCYFVSKILIILILIGLSIVANSEFLNLVRNKGFSYSWKLSLLFCVFFPVLMVVLSFGLITTAALVGFFYLSLLIFILSNFSHVENSIVNVSLQVFSHLYITLPLSFLYLILFMQTLGLEGDGRVWLAYLIFVVKGSDVGGYFFGSIFGKNYFVPKISPKKTLEGLFGGIVFSVLISLSFFLLGKEYPLLRFKMSFMESLLLGLVLCLVSQLGDLVESLFKRDAKIKDSNSIPGIGGVLDVVDSLLFTTPLLLAYLLMCR